MRSFLLFTFLSFACIAQAQMSANLLPVSNDLVYTSPSFPSGEEALFRFMQDKLHYPELAVEYNIEGMVVARIQLDQEGNIQSASIVKTLGFGCDKAVLELIRQMPQWEPARYGNQAQYGVVYLPVKFSLR